MKNLKTKSSFLVATLLVASFILLGTGIQTAKAVTLDELQAQIEALMAQITELRQEKARLEQGQTWCHDFNINLKFGDNGNEITALETALQKQNFSVHVSSSNSKGTFDAKIASAVVGFQEKYKQDILGPYNLQHGTGYVGPTTRAKLNKLYGCDNAPSTCNDRNISIWDWDYCTPECPCDIGEGDCDTDADCNGDYHCVMDVGTDYGQDSEMDVCRAEATTPTSCHTKPLWDWDYCTPECPCDIGEGDCDTDADCNGDYHCVMDVGTDYGQDSEMDVCEEKATTTIPTCIDTDPEDALLGLMKGTVYGINSKGSKHQTNDYCNEDGTQVNEMYCRDNSGGQGKIAGARIIDCENGCVGGACSEEADFSITIIAPNGSEQWKVGERHTIKWDSTGIDKITIALVKNKQIQDYIVENFTASNKDYSWSMPTTLASGTDYSLRFFDEGNVIKETNHFAIVAGSTATPTSCHTKPLWDWNYCTSECPCEAGEGDCDTDADCKTGYCAQDVGLKYGRIFGLDICENKDGTPTPTCDVSFSGYTASREYLKSNTHGTNPDGVEYEIYDSCNEDETAVNETYCYNNPNGQGRIAGTKVINCQYGCENGSCKRGLTVTFPKKEDQLEIGKTYKITWDQISPYQGGSGIELSLVTGSIGNFTGRLIGGADVLDKSKNWNIPLDIVPGSNYRIQIDLGNSSESTRSTNRFNLSDYFSIATAPISCHTKSPTPMSEEYCTPDCQCNAYEGDCDTDADCATGYCAHNVGKEYGLHYTMDLCLPETHRKAMVPTCIDADMDPAYYPGFMKSYVYGVNPDGIGYNTYDSCNENETAVNEMYCRDNPGGQGKIADTKVIDCPYSCTKGACRKKIIVKAAPSNGEQLKMGETYELEWDSAGIKTISIGLLKDGKFSGTVTLGVPASEKHYSWKLRENYNHIGDNYSLHFDSTFFSGVKTDSFSIVAGETDSSITVTSPNNGEQLKIGETHEIKWNFGKVYRFNVYLENWEGQPAGGPLTWQIAKNISKTSGIGPMTYNWTIPKDIQPKINEGSYYKIRIEDADNPLIYDGSKKYFTIFATPDSCYIKTLWDKEYCTPECPCDIGEGDCDTDSDCKTGQCVYNVGEQYETYDERDICLTRKEYSAPQESLMTLKTLENMEYQTHSFFAGYTEIGGSLNRKIKLTNGVFFPKPPSGKSQSDYYVEIEKVVFGNLNNDTFEDAAVVLRNVNGDKIYRNIAAVISDEHGDGSCYSLGTSYIHYENEPLFHGGEKIEITGLDITPGIWITTPDSYIIVKMKQKESPYAESVKEYHVTNGVGRISESFSYGDEDKVFVEKTTELGYMEKQLTSASSAISQLIENIKKLIGK